MILALQTYTVRKHAKADLPGSLDRIKSMGLTQLEWARLPIGSEEANLLRERGMTVVSIQAKAKILERHFSRVVAFCRSTDCSLVIVSVLSLSGILGGTTNLRGFANRLNELAARYRQAGVRLAFHHHDFEFKRLRGEYKLDWLVRWTDPSVSFILDTYWIQRSGQDPRAWIERIGDRVCGLHLRDCLPPPRRGKPGDCPLGMGTIPFTKVLESLPSSVLYGAIEQNSHDPWTDLAISCKYMNVLEADRGVREGGPLWKTGK